MASVLLLVPSLALVSALTPTAAPFPYEQMVTARLSQCKSKAEASAYLNRHSTRYMLREAGVPETAVYEACAMIGTVVPTISARAIESAPIFLDEQAALAKSEFPISEETLISKA